MVRALHQFPALAARSGWPAVALVFALTTGVGPWLWHDCPHHFGAGLRRLPVAAAPAGHCHGHAAAMPASPAKPPAGDDSRPCDCQDSACQLAGELPRLPAQVPAMELALVVQPAPRAQPACRQAATAWLPPPATAPPA